MPLRLVELIRRYVFRFVLVPALAVTAVGVVVAGAFAIWLETRAESQLLDANANVFEQLILSGDSVGLDRQLRAVASSRQWVRAYIIGPESRVIAAYPNENEVGVTIKSLPCRHFKNLIASWDAKVGRLCWESNRLKMTIPAMLPFLGVMAVIIWLQAALGVILGRLISRHTKSLEDISTLFGRSQPFDPEELASMPQETLEEAHLLQAVRQFVVFEKQIKSVEIESAKQRALSGIASQVAHDIRSPLAALDSILKDVSQLPEEKRVIVRSAVSRIRDIANHLIEKNREAQAIAKGAAGTAASSIVAEPASVELLSSHIDPLITEKRLQFRSKIGVEIEGRLDVASYGLFAEIQPTEFKRVLSNLINNSVEALGDKGMVTVSLVSKDDHILLKVQDTGKGIPPEILAKLGQRGETHGKASGSGLGLYHAKTSAESWGGSLEIASEVGKGTTLTLKLPQAQPPDWFVSTLELEPNKAVVVLDDDTSIHQVWQGRFDSHKAKEHGIEIFHFSTPEELRDFARASPAQAQSALYLTDYELIGHKETGLGLVEELNLGDRSILITSRFDEKNILAECRRLKVRMIPKGLAGFVPISIQAPIGGTVAGLKNPKPLKLDAVLLDDDALVRMNWKMAAKSKGLNFAAFKDIREFRAAVNGLPKDTPIYLDCELGDGVRGDVVAKELHEQGFANLYLATGHDPESFPAAPWLKGVLSKTSPWQDAEV